MNTDSRNWWIEEASKYEWDGPKNQFDPDQLCDFYEKMCNDHPLLSYIEDAFLAEHIPQYKSFQSKVHVNHPHVEVAVSGSVMFNNDLEAIRELTSFIQPEPEEEDPSMRATSPEIGSSETPAPTDGATPAEKVEEKKEKPQSGKKASKDAKGGKKSAKGTKEEEKKDEPAEDAKPDPNADKFAPNIIRL